MKKGGYLLINLMKGIDEGYDMAGTFESLVWKKRSDVLFKIVEISNYKLVKEVDTTKTTTLYILKK